MRVAGPEHRDPVHIPLSQDELASALGVVRSSVTPWIKTWKEGGLVTVERGSVVIGDIAALARIAELNLALNQPAEINGTGVISRAVCASVAVDEQDTEALRRYRESQRTRHLVDLNAAIRREEIAYFDGLLTDPRQATAWWFHRNSSKVEQLPAVAETFTILSGRPRPRESDRQTAGEVVVYQSEPDSRGAILEEFLSGTDEPTALILDRFVTRLFEQQQQTDLLDRWRDLSRPATETMAQAREAHDS